MRKSDIERLARRRQQQAKPTATHVDAPRITQDRADDSGDKSQGHECACACAAKLADIEKGLNAQVEIGFVLARIAAVDTVHTTEQPATLFKRAISEGLLALDLFRATIGAGRSDLFRATIGVGGSAQ